MKPIRHIPYSKTSYLPEKLTYSQSSLANELLYIIDLQHKELDRLQLVIAHKFKEVAACEKEIELSGQIHAEFGRI